MSNRPSEEELQEILKRSVSIYGEDKSKFGVHILQGTGVTIMARTDVPKLWKEIQELRKENEALKKQTESHKYEQRYTLIHA